jgi:hypothetical protein
LAEGAAENCKDRASEKRRGALWLLFDETGEALFPELMVELAAI